MQIKKYEGGVPKQIIDVLLKITLLHTAETCLSTIIATKAY